MHAELIDSDMSDTNRQPMLQLSPLVKHTILACPPVAVARQDDLENSTHAGTSWYRSRMGRQNGAWREISQQSEFYGIKPANVLHHRLRCLIHKFELATLMWFNHL